MPDVVVGVDRFQFDVFTKWQICPFWLHDNAQSTVWTHTFRGAIFFTHLYPHDHEKLVLSCVDGNWNRQRIQKRTFSTSLRLILLCGLCNANRSTRY
ncbi:hypothetical protein T09_7691 [Trichinella sp. T9]|nr:hypothetical protein T09_7691 [Trichinella sp. T9]